MEELQKELNRLQENKAPPTSIPNERLLKLQRREIQRKRPRLKRPRLRKLENHPRRPDKLSRSIYKLAKHKRILNAKLSKKRKLLKNSSTNDSDIKDCVLNLSSSPISTDELSVLSKGLTFIPKPKHMDIRDLFKDTKQFAAKM